MCNMQVIPHIITYLYERNISNKNYALSVYEISGGFLISVVS